MSRFGKTIVLILLLLGAMLLLTYVSPGIKAFATDLSKQSHLPIWLVGLAAPILFFFNKLGGFLNGLFGEGETERSIREKNDEIKAKLDEVERSVQQLDEWRRSEIEPRLRRIDELQQNIGSMEGHAATLTERLQGLDQEDERLRGERERLRRESDELRGSIRDIE
ncbi:MAG: hypothetical protein AUH07_05500 [Gemmatimonadetes bacterium 13_2_20CM_70_9]|uniref:Uncharacterized protein n=1 Tax=Candidatus Segetimicrobium genomatis TaxID=2569760 RepID=A0A537KRV1_9BACT|nr:MAG: hypothetical protein AUH07_05500 [Gemmatimonadetes bacterium 13_2_20CM_70_9]PYP70568.1 MAG: hypothetical protein DMD41_14670 [Gemmatimonadota bacterium]TMI98432.1 MAG: hypothetical protein E6H01_12355 [Terrabacteria group bacterium ANGP1]